MPPPIKRPGGLVRGHGRPMSAGRGMAGIQDIRMNGELAQCVVLTSFGNAWLHAENPDPVAAALENHSVFQHVRTIQFGEAEPEAGAPAFAHWVASLRDKNPRRLWLSQPETLCGTDLSRASAFANACSRGILVDSDDHCQLWWPLWSIRDAESTWRVHYRTSTTTAPPNEPDLAAATHSFRQAVADALEFAEASGWKHWAGCFAESLDCLRSAHVANEYLPPCGYSPEARRLLAAADIAWVFGGMGSWNDLAFSVPDRQARYLTVTDQLYRAVHGAIVGATNAFDPGLLAT